MDQFGSKVTDSLVNFMGCGFKLLSAVAQFHRQSVIRIRRFQLFLQIGCGVNQIGQLMV